MCQRIIDRIRAAKKEALLKCDDCISRMEMIRDELSITD